MEVTPALAIRSSVGIELWNSAGLKIPYVPNQNFPRDESKFCRAIVFSADGRFLAWANGTKVEICATKDWKIIFSLPRPKTFYLKFSPSGKYLVTWELFITTKDNAEGTPNLNVYSTADGNCIFSTIQKKNTDWEPHWSMDESILAFMVGGEAFFYETNEAKGFEKPAKKIGGARNGSISISPFGTNPYVAFHLPGAKGSPSMCKIFKYPDLQAAQPIGCKSFFQADRVEMMWNKRSTGLILLTSTEVDSTGASYYGKQALHFMSTRGDSFAVQLKKDGPIHSVSWNPNSTEFCVIYGFMPAKASFFNLKCDSTFDSDEGAINSIYYNPFGNLVILAGFGNLRGNVEVWDVAKKKIVSTLQAPDSTMLEWCQSGEIFVTATTAPRLRMSNGFKVWHYSGALLHETMWPEGQELLEVIWQTYPSGTFTEQPITNVKLEGIKSTQPQASAQAYKPPNARGINIPRPSTATNDNSIPVSAGRKDRRNRPRPASHSKNKSEENDDAKHNDSTSSNNAQSQKFRPISRDSAKKPSKPEDLEKAKRIRALNKKLSDISKLKTRRDKGEHLELNQVQKIDSETSLMKELNDLKIT
ncbi:Eukaryotic translation initiation factor 2A [Pseudolycoriella hygida]|uniref:Eukaryotic translation initiation factor 2A n=1 Tax=Pseudolycoriella hygida TaxID=35572 RepID=A0A9Q0MNK2_9DIPT|nr:Eukaryotic translation initiation factor 2A [Pseudolycoriella hygida]